MKLNPMVTEDKMCRSKRRYATVQDAAAGAARVSCGKPKLYGYQCPFCSGFHLTKFQRPINPEFKDRVNIDLSALSGEHKEALQMTGEEIAQRRRKIAIETQHLNQEIEPLNRALADLYSEDEDLWEQQQTSGEHKEAVK